MDIFKNTLPAENLITANLDYVDQRIDLRFGCDVISPQFRDKPHMAIVDVMTYQGEILQGVLKLHGTYSNYKGDNFSNELLGYTHALTHKIPCPDLLIAGTTNRGQQFIITEYMKDAKHLHEIIWRDSPSLEELEDALNLGLNLVIRSNLQGLTHGDLDGVNILVKNGNAHFIDFGQTSLNPSRNILESDMNVLMSHLILRGWEACYDDMVSPYQLGNKIVQERIKSLEAQGVTIVRYNKS